MKFTLSLLAVVGLAMGTTVKLESERQGPAPKPFQATALTPENIEQGIEQERKQQAYDNAEEIASRFYRAQCGTDEFAEVTAHSAVDARLPVRVVAAVVFVESTCRADVVSDRGAVGLMQVEPRTWHVTKDQLRDPSFNIRKGTEILARYRNAYGLRAGLHHYLGMGETDGQIGGEVYAVRVMSTAGMQ